MSNYTRTWALAEDGIVGIVETADHAAGHPFGKLEANQRAIDVTKVECHPGYFADSHGNVASIPGRTAPLAPGEPAYHDRAVVPAEHAAVRNQYFYTAEPHPLDRKESFPAEEDAD